MEQVSVVEEELLSKSKQFDQLNLNLKFGNYSDLLIERSFSDYNLKTLICIKDVQSWIRWYYTI